LSLRKVDVLRFSSFPLRGFYVRFCTKKKKKKKATTVSLRFLPLLFYFVICCRPETYAVNIVPVSKLRNKSDLLQIPDYLLKTAVTLEFSCWPTHCGFVRGQSMQDLWWTKWHWDRLLSDDFGFALADHFANAAYLFTYLWSITLNLSS
jgi:hypothetical protein